ncbi:MAG: cardiolipin synthase [Andreesenia angusta]|nr:cardiolipin synthase [Andreesenia angusta]
MDRVLSFIAKNFIYIIIFINMIFVFYLIFHERRDESSTLSWILVLTHLPIIGFLFYLVLGQRFNKRKLYRKKADAERKRIEAQMKKIDSADIKEEIKRFEELIKLNYNSEGSIYSQDNELELIFDGKEKFKKLFKDIDEAKEFIHLEYYTIENDSLGKEIIDRLINKAKEGVEVKVLMDTLGSMNLISKKCLRELEEAGGEFAAFFPKKFSYFSKRINFINHRKIVVIDKRVGYLGGFNIGESYISENEKVGYWRDTHMRIKGSFLNDLERRFLFDWCYSNQLDINDFHDYLEEEVKEKNGSVGMQLVSSGPDIYEPYIRNGILKMINEAKESIFIQTPYFVPDDPIYESLKVAALSGIDVRLMVPKHNDHKFMRWAASAKMLPLLECGVKIYLYEKNNKGFLHAKTLVIDSEISTIGTANMDVRSFKLNFETNAFIFDSGVSEIQYNKFLEDSKECDLIKLEEFRNRSRTTKMCESVVRLFSPLL